MAGALNKQGRLLYFYGLGGGSGDGARVFVWGGGINMRYPGKKRFLFPSWDGNSNEGIALASNNNNHDEYKFEVRGNVEFETPQARNMVNIDQGFIILNSNLISINMWFSQSSFFMIFFSLHSHKNHSHLIPHFHSFLQGDTPLPVPRGFLFLHLEAVYGWLHQGSDCSWDFHVLFQRKRWHWK